MPTHQTLADIIHSTLIQTGNIRPSPDWDHDPQAAQILTTLPRYVRHLRLCPPPGMDVDDWLGDLRLTLILRSQSRKSRWDPTRGRQTVASWVALILRSRSQNVWRNERKWQSRVQVLPPGQDHLIEGYSGAPVWL